jgi:hypothetical protein
MILQEKKEKKEIRNIKFGGSVTKSEYNLIRNLSKKLKLSKTELLVRAVIYYNDYQKNLLETFKE